MSTMLLETCTELKQTYRKRIVRQVGNLQELYRDALSTEHKKNGGMLFQNWPYDCVHNIFLLTIYYIFQSLAVKTAKSVALYCDLFSVARMPLSGAEPPLYRGLTIMLRSSTWVRTPLDEWSAWHREIYLTTHNTHNIQICMLLAVFEPAVTTSERP
jgi:hypothetical protein